MGAIASQITSLTIVYSTVYSDADQRKHQCSALLAFVQGIHQGPVNSPHKWTVTRKMFPFDDVIMYILKQQSCSGRLKNICPQCHRVMPISVIRIIPTKGCLVGVPLCPQAKMSVIVGFTHHPWGLLSKIISWKYTISGNTFMVRISSWNFVRVPKAWLWAHVQGFSLKFT